MRSETRERKGAPRSAAASASAASTSILWSSREWNASRSAPQDPRLLFTMWKIMRQQISISKLVTEEKCDSLSYVSARLHALRLLRGWLFDFFFFFSVFFLLLFRTEFPLLCLFIFLLLSIAFPFLCLGVWRMACIHYWSKIPVRPLIAYARTGREVMNESLRVEIQRPKWCLPAIEAVVIIH